MTFSVYVPPHAEGARLPVVWYLSGLTCTHANVTDKGEYRRACAELGLCVRRARHLARGEGVADDPAYDFGQGAGFYVDATQPYPGPRTSGCGPTSPKSSPRWSPPSSRSTWAAQAITGHSMGGHGALTIGLTYPDRYRSVSAFAPIAAPSQVPWGEKALGGYLGPDRQAWRKARRRGADRGRRASLPELLVDVGDADPFLAEQLRPELLQDACAEAAIDLTLRIQPGYDHSYNFISTFMANHLAWHAARLA